MKYCTKCGNELLDEAVVCPKCGCLVNGSLKPNADNKEEKRSTRSGALIASCICFFIGLFFMATYIWHYIDIIQVEEGLSFLLLILYAFTVGWITVLPGLVLMIVAMVNALICFKSSKKSYQVVGKILFVCSLIFIIATIISFLAPTFVAYSKS